MNFPTFGGNWIDLIIIAIIIYFASEAFRIGFWAILANFVSFFASLFVALWGYQYASALLQDNFALSRSSSNAVGFFLTAVIAEGVMSYLTILSVSKMPSGLFKKWWGKALAIIPGAGEGLVLISFILTLFLTLPIYPKVKADITESKIGGAIIKQTSGLEAKIDDIFGGVIEDSLTYLTVKPGSRETIPITTEIYERGLEVDAQSEAEMFALVNQERRKQGIHELTLRSEVVPVARAHATDMWERQYFGHVSPDGKDVGDRLDEAGISYVIAGENLALAPTVSTAHNGLMNSEGHRANILEPKFKRLAIGVIDNGVYGKIFVQVFTD